MATMTIRLPLALLRQTKSLAAAQHRSLNAHVLYLLERSLREEYIPQPAAPASSSTSRRPRVR